MPVQTAVGLRACGQFHMRLISSVSFLGLTHGLRNPGAFLRAPYLATEAREFFQTTILACTLCLSCPGWQGNRANRASPDAYDAAHALAKQIGRKRVSCTRRDTDRYGRMVARCTVQGVDISQWMVMQGQAIAFRKYSLDYIPDEDRARAATAGIWAGEFQDPSDFRHQKRGGQGSPRPNMRHHRGTHAAPALALMTRTVRGHRCGGRSSNLRLGGRTSACVARK